MTAITADSERPPGNRLPGRFGRSVTVPKSCGQALPMQSISVSFLASSIVSEKMKLRVRNLLAIFPCGLFKPALERSVR